MKKLLEILRLSYDNKLSVRQIAQVTNVSKSAVSDYLQMFNQSGLKWPLDQQDLNEEVLSSKLKPGYQASNKNILKSKLDFTEIHQELRLHKALTLQLLWEDYQAKSEMPYSYGHFAKLYKDWQNKQPSYMKQVYKGGEKVFVDYSGDTVRIWDKATGRIIANTQIFVGVLGASNLMYAEATNTQRLCDWTMSHVRMFEYFGGVPELVVLDNLKSGVIKPHRYDPDITPAYYQMLAHYKTAALPARVAKPKDKSKVENGVLIIQRWILAKLRNMRFYSLQELNKYIREQIDLANNKQMKLYQCSRLELFNKLDKPNLKSLPTVAYEYQDYQKIRVSGGYHILLDHHNYSVPYSLVKEEVDVWYSPNKLEVYYQGKCVAMHVRSYENGGNTTSVEHMPVGHRKYVDMNADTIKQMAKEIGVATELIVENILTTSDHEAIGCRKSYGFLKLAKQYGKYRLEAACNHAINTGISDYKNIAFILSENLTNAQVADNPPVSIVAYHSNVRGSEYYN